MNLEAPHVAIEIAVIGFEIAGVLAITFGSFIALYRFFFNYKGAALTDRSRSLRQDIGGAIVLGLEFLVAADVIRTVVIEPSLRNVAVLGLIVLVRTFLSYTLHMENKRFFTESRERQKQERRFEG